MNQREKGAVSVFLSLLLSSVILFDFCLTDCAEAACAAVNIRLENELALQSVLSEYDLYLHDTYGLYGLSRFGDEYFTNKLYGYLKKDDEYSGVKYFNAISDYDVLNIDFNKKSSLYDGEVLKGQIGGIMKYYATEEAALKITEYFKEIKDKEESEKSFGRYKEITQSVKEAEECYDKLYDSVFGKYSDDNECAAGYNRDNVKLLTDVMKKCIQKPVLDDLFCTTARVYYAYISEYRDIFGRALSEAEKLKKLGESLKKDAEELQKSIDKGENSELYARTVKEIKKICRKIDNTEVIYILSENFDKSDKLCTKTETLITQIRIYETQGNEPDRELIYDILNEADIEIKTDYHMEKNLSDVSDEKIDIIDKSTELAENLFNDKGKPVIDEELFKTLPSQQKEEKDNDDFDISDTDNFSKLIINASEDISDSFLTDEYIMKYFKNEKTLGSKTYSYLGAEVEYIIVGKRDESDNLKGVKTRILGLRYIFNLAYLLSDSDKTDFARKAGDSMAAAYSEGVGGPVYTAAIISAWTLAESALDLNDLLNSKKVPLIKTSDNWKLDLLSGNPSDDGTDSDKEEKGLLYADYLRILLLFTSESKKISRIQDLIELNVTKFTGIRYKLSEVYTYIESEIYYRIDLFIAGKRRYEYKIKSGKSYF